MKKHPNIKWLRKNFLTGLAIALPVFLSVALIRWIFGAISNVTDILLVFIPRSITHSDGGPGPVYWYWSLFALLFAAFLITLLGLATRYYVTKKLILAFDNLMSKVPLLNKIYGTIKQVNEAFTSSKKTSFKQVVMIEYPRKGTYSIGFITNETVSEAQDKTGENMVCVFIPTTPNPTSGFLVLAQKDEIIKLDMSVADAIKYVVSLGSLTPEIPKETTEKE
jgi:uncharacterized membrane protein